MYFGLLEYQHTRVVLYLKGLEQEQPKSDLGRFGIELLFETIFQYL